MRHVNLSISQLLPDDMASLDNNIWFSIICDEAAMLVQLVQLLLLNGRNCRSRFRPLLGSRICGKEVRSSEPTERPSSEILLLIFRFFALAACGEVGGGTRWSPEAIGGAVGI
jgi:hypothetical protein